MIAYKKIEQMRMLNATVHRTCRLKWGSSQSWSPKMLDQRELKKNNMMLALNPEIVHSQVERSNELFVLRSNATRVTP